MGENLTDYFREATGERSMRAIAQRAGVEQTTFNRQLNGTSSLTVETVVAICRAYKLDMADTFVRAGFVTEDEAQRLGARLGLGAFSDLELAKEIVDRIARGEASEALTGELPVPSDDAAGRVVPIRANVPSPIENLTRRPPRTQDRAKIAANEAEPRETDQPAPGEHPND